MEPVLHNICIKIDELIPCVSEYCNCKLNKKYHIFTSSQKKVVGYPDIGELDAYIIQYINNTNFYGISGKDIVRKFQKENLPLPTHFLQYVEMVRKIDYPTLKEIEEEKILKEIQKKENNEREKKSNEYFKQKRIKEEEINKIVNKTKASSRLEKLKAQNSITK